MKPIGILKTKSTVHCEVCGSDYTRNLKGFIYENTEKEIEHVKNDLLNRANAKYVCKVCKSITNTL